MKNILCIAALIFFNAGPVFAQTLDSSLYGGLEAGTSSKLNDKTNATTSMLVSNYGGRATTTQDLRASGYRLFMGYRVNEHLGLEVGFLQTARFKISTTGRTAAGVDYTQGDSTSYGGFDYTVVIRPDVESANGQLFLRFGLTDYKRETVSALSAGGQNESHAKGVGYLSGLGYEIPIESNLKIRVAATKLTKISSESDKASVYSIGLLRSF